MSFSSILDKLTTLVSKAYLFSAFIPTVVFAFVNGLILYFVSSGFRNWAAAQIEHPRAFYMTAMVVGLAVGAYMLSSVNVALREVLEGNRFLTLFPSIARWLTRYQESDLSTIRSKYKDARDNRLRIAEQKRTWQAWMSRAALFGLRFNTGRMIYAPATSNAGKRVQTLRRKQSSAIPPSSRELLDAVYDLCDELQSSDESIGATSSDASPLGADRVTMLSLFDYAQRSWGALEVRYFNERQTRFGVGYVAPTSMGNVAESMQGYGMSRYSLDLATLWSRLQVTLQQNKDFYSTLQDAKTQLDFLVACWWLNTITWLSWTALLLVHVRSATIFLAVTIGGPLLSYFFYSLAVTNYMAFAQLVCTALDLYRFSLLQALSLPLPPGIRQERLLWKTLQSVASFGDEGIELSYQITPKTSGT